MRTLLVAAICAALPVAVVAQAFRAENRLLVVPLGGAEFEVIEAYGEGARGMWCAAADYVETRLGISDKVRIYVKTPRGPSVSAPGRKGVVFTTDARRLAVAPRQSLSVTVREPGVGLPVHHAYQFCYDYRFERDEFPRGPIIRRDR